MAKTQKKNTPADVTPKEQKPVPQPAKPKPQAMVSDTPVADFFDKLGNKAWLVSLGLIFIVAFIVFKDYLTFDKAYMFKDIGSDTFNGLYPYRYYTADQVAKGHFPTWSYDWGIGQNIFALIFRDPFDIFLFIGGKDHIMYGIIYKELFKILLGGVTFFFYLRTMKLSNFTSVAGSLMFAFCSFMIIGGAWNYFSYEAFAAALLLLAFEKLFVEKKWFLFPIAIFIIAISTPVNLYIYGLFLALYAILRCIQTGITDIKGIASVFLKMIGYGSLGLLLSAPFLIENIFVTLESPRGNGSSSYAHILSSTPMFSIADNMNLGTSVMRFFSGDILGSGNDFKGVQNLLEAPMFYCGIPCLLLMPQVFPFLAKRVRIAFIVFAAVWLLPIIFPYFRYAFWLFTGDYYRAYSFLVALMFLFFSMQALDMIIQKRKINLVTLIVTVIVLFILLNYPYFPDRSIVSSSIFTFVCTLLLAYAGLLFFMGKQNSPVYVKYIFLGLVFCEVMYFSNISANERDAVTAAELTQKVGYNDYSMEALNYVRANDHTNSFYRIDKNYWSSPAMHGSLNDGMVQGYHGTSSYNSFNQGNYISYLGLFGVVDISNELTTRWASGLNTRPILESENRVKYILARGNINPLWYSICDTLGTFGNIKLFRNKLMLPIGYTYDKFLPESAFKSLGNTQKDFVSLSTCVVSDKDVTKVAGLAPFQLRDTIAPNAFSIDIYKQRIDELAKDSLKVAKFDESEISGTIDLATDKMMYISIPYDDGWNLKVNGQKTDKIKLFSGMTGIMLKKGHNDVVMTYHQRYIGAALMMVLLGLLAYIGLGVFTWRKNKITVS